MRFLDDLFDPPEIEYPTMKGNAPAPPVEVEKAGFFSRIFNPTLLEYPAPTVAPAQCPTLPAPAPSANPPAPTANPAPAPVVTAPTNPAPANPAPAPVVTPPANPQPAPSVVVTPKSVRAYCFNPELLAEMLDRQSTKKLLDELLVAPLVVSDAAPVAFAVPDGCDSVDPFFGPIELNPGEGVDGDLDLVITTGEAKLSVDVASTKLAPGQQVVVTVPWRAAPWVTLPASHLRMAVVAQFYKSA